MNKTTSTGIEELKKEFKNNLQTVMVSHIKTIVYGMVVAL